MLARGYGGATALVAWGLVMSGCGNSVAQWGSETSRLAFEVAPSPEVADTLPPAGRLFVLLSQRAEPEPRLGVGWAGPEAEPFFARDLDGWAGGEPAVLDDQALGFPVPRASDLPPGTYFAQALYDVDTTFSSINAPGNFYGPPVRVEIGAGTTPQRFRLTLEARIPPETLPDETDYVKFVRIESRLLSEFWGRPMHLRAAVVLPRGYDEEQDRRYPVRYHIGGFGSRYTEVLDLMKEGAAFHTAWLSDHAPRMLFVHLDGEGPFGDSYQMDSANNGPYGRATLEELMPEIEGRFRAVGTPRGRFLDGGSTGGWVALALQIFYPDSFNGAWSFCPDSVDFRYFQLVNIYEDANAFINQHGYERPSMRDTDGEPRFSIRREVTMERVLGRGDTFVTSGGQWGAWNAVYSPRGADGLPLPIWDPATGVIHRQVAESWRKYDLRHVLQENWPTLGPKLQGKIRIWMGEMDSFYLNNALYLLEVFLQQTENPRSDARIVYGPRQGHCWVPFSQMEILRQMMERFEMTSGAGG